MSGSDPRFDEILAAWMQADASGREALLAAHPEYAERLRRFAENEAWLRGAVRGDGTLDAPTLASGAVPAEASPVRVRYVGDYELVEEIARGAFGVVYRARQISLNRPVALKMLLAGDHAGPEQARRFRSEAEAAANLDHPNIVPVYEVGEHEGMPYFSMKLVEGRSLAAAMPEMRGDPRRAAALLAKAARAVHHAHQRGVLHRDVKPANILLDGAGELYVADFGLGRRLEDAARSATGIVGSPAYMPPEQAREEKGLTVAADVWSLGAVLYEMLAGRPPFGGANVLEVLRAVVGEEPAKVEGDLGVVALTCLEKEPAKRYASAAELADELERWLRGEPILARSAGPAERLWRWARREPVTASLVSAVAGVLVVGTAVAWGLAAWALGEKGRANQEALAARKAEREADENGRQATANAALAKTKADAATRQALLSDSARHSSDISLGIRAWESNGLEEAEQLLARMPAPFRQSWETRHLQARCLRKSLPLLGHRHQITAVAFSPDGSRIATASNDRAVRVWDAVTGRCVLTLQGRRKIRRCVVYSPDGKHIIAGDDSIVRIYDAVTGEVFRSLEGGEDGWFFKCVAVSPDGSRIVGGSLATEGGTLLVWDAHTGKILHRLLRESVLCVAFSPDGLRIASAGVDGALRVWDSATGKQLLCVEREFRTRKGRSASFTVDCLAFSPDGTRIATGGGTWTSHDTMRYRMAFVSGELKVRDARTGRVLTTIFEDDAAGVSCVAFSPDGRRIASASDLTQELFGSWDAQAIPDTSLKVWDVQTGEQIQALTGHKFGVTGVAFSPDGQRLVSGSKDFTARVWDLRATPERIAFRGHDAGVLCVAHSPDGSRIASGGKDGAVMVWDAGTGRVLLSLGEPRSQPFQGDLPPLAAVLELAGE